MLKRDGYTCRRCALHDPTGKQLAAHHVKPGYHTSAGITLCDRCHKELDANAR